MVGSFTDPNSAAVAGDFTATIHWGDGSTTGGNIAWNANTQSFDVTGTHTYDPYGTHTLTLTIDGDGGGSDSDTSTVTVADAAIHSTGVDVSNATEGTSTGSVLLATFTDDDPNVNANIFSASVDWGDGSGADTNTNITENDGVFSVFGTHTYDHAGDHTITTTISDPGGSSSIASSTATVDNAVVSATPGSIRATEGQSASGVLASFTDANAAADASDFTASIDWGDGNISSGDVVWNNGTNQFDVSGSNTYDHAGHHTVTVTIDGAYGEVASTNFDTLVANQTITVTAQPSSGPRRASRLIHSRLPHSPMPTPLRPKVISPPPSTGVTAPLSTQTPPSSPTAISSMSSPGTRTPMPVRTR